MKIERRKLESIFEPIKKMDFGNVGKKLTKAIEKIIFLLLFSYFRITYILNRT